MSNQNKKTAKKKVARKSASKSAKKNAETPCVEGDPNSRAWRIAQLAAQLAASPQLSIEVRKPFVPVVSEEAMPSDERTTQSEPILPDDAALDGWFRSLLNRAEWLLESLQNKRVLFEDLFERSKRYSYAEIAGIMKAGGVGPPWYSPKTLTGKLKEIDELVIGHYAKYLADSLLSYSVDDKTKHESKRAKYVEDVTSLLRSFQGSAPKLREKLVGLVPRGCISIRTSAEDAESKERSGVSIVSKDADGYYLFDREIHDLPSDFLDYQRASRLTERQRVKTGSKGGNQASMQVDAQRMFLCARLDGLPEEYWSFYSKG